MKSTKSLPPKIHFSLRALLLALIPIFAAANCLADTDMVWTYGSGKNYSSLSTWEQDTDIIITSANNVVVVAHGGLTGSVGNGDTVTGATSGATGVVVGVVTSSQICIDVTSGDFQSGEQIYETQDVNYVVSTSAEDTLGIMYLDCYDGPHNDYVDLAGATTDSNHYRCIRSASDCTTPFAGKRETGAYFETTHNDDIFTVTENYCRVEHVGGKLTNTHATANRGVFDVLGNYCKVVGCVMYSSSSTGSGVVHGILMQGNNGLVVNSVAHNNTGDGFRLSADTGESNYAYNCTAVDNGEFGFDERVAGSNYVWNCVGDSNTGGDFDTGFASGSNYNMSKDTTAPGTNSKISKSFTNMWASETSGSEDYHLSATGEADSDFQGGADPSGTLNPPDYTLVHDIDGQERDTWYRGADEYNPRVYVWSGGSDVSPYISWATAAHSIQDAIDAASSGNIVIVRAGTYNETITMKDGVDVVSETTVQPTISRSSGTGEQEVVTFSGSMTCDLKGFEITNQIDGAGVFLNGSGGGITTTIEDCDIHDNTGGAGIRLNGVVSPTVTGCNIYSNGEAGIATCVITHGDQLASGSSITIKENTIGGSTQGNTKAGIRLDGSGSNIQVTIGGSTASDGNAISYNGGAGIRLEDIDKVSIENNSVGNNGIVSSNSEAGILLIDVDTVSPHIRNNDIYDQTKAGINIGGASKVTIGDNNDIYENYAGIVFYVSTNTDPDVTGTASSQLVEITGNDIYSNAYSGIAIRDPITDTVTITQNHIYQNSRGGIGIQNSCELEIIKNDIYDNVRGGIHTGTDVANDLFNDTTGFLGGPGSAVLTIRQNKVHDNGGSGYGGGIDVRHASGTIENNLVYNNDRGGIRFGWENAGDSHVTDIKNNTVVGNGNATQDKGGGIIYDNLAGYVNASPEGIPPGKLNIKNNICAYNQKAGMRACFVNTQGSEERDYNLLYANYPWDDVHLRYNKPDCGWPDNLPVMSCSNQQHGGCGAYWDYGQDYSVVPNDPHNKMANPLFKYDCLIDDDTATGNTPGNGTYILFDLHKGYPDPTTYTITDVRLYGSATTYTWNVYVGSDPSGCTGSWGTLVKSNWSVGSGWYQTSVTQTSGRYIKLVTTGDINENTIFEFDYKSTENGEDWQTPVMVVYKCTNIAEDNYELLSSSPAVGAGAGGVDMGAYGGTYPIDW